jgi:dethiobiotin synthetase
MSFATPPGLLVTGTDTGVGKTFLTAALLAHLRGEGVRVGALKPVATGASRIGEDWHSEDGAALIEALGGGVDLRRVVPILYEEPLAPCVAARRAGTPLLQADLLREVASALEWWSTQADLMLVEGVGGLLCPLAEGTTVADLAIALDYPLLIVARRGLGTLNHTLLTVEAAQSRGLRVAGVVLNGAEPTQAPIAEATNPDELSRRLGTVPLLLDLPYGIDHVALRAQLAIVDWAGLARPPRLSGLVPSRA